MLKKHWPRLQQLLHPISITFVVATGLLWTFALVSFVFGIWTSPEISSKYLSLQSVVLLLVFPVSVMALSFLVQILSVYVEARQRYHSVREESRLLAAIDHCLGGDGIQRFFLTLLLADFHRAADRLREGAISIKETHWEVAAEIFENFAHTQIECTSAIPLYRYQSASGKADAQLAAYLQRQERVIARNIRIRRTFIIDSALLVRGDDDLALRRFLKVALTHLEAGFEVYYVDLADVPDSSLHERLLADFALVDDRILMYGRLATANREVYLYDFYDLLVLQRSKLRNTSVVQIFKDPTAFQSGDTPRLLVKEHRSGLPNYRNLQDPRYHEFRSAIEGAWRKHDFPSSQPLAS